MNDAPGTAVAASPEVRARTAMERSNLYGFLAAIFREEASTPLLRRMKEPGLLQALEGAGVAFDQAIFDRPEDELVEDLAAEYTRLFIGPGSHIPPYSAIHLGGEGASLWGPSTTWVQRYIEAAGFEYRPDYRELPDHIGVELEFMQVITAREAWALEEQNEDKVLDLRNIEEDFISEHLARWVPIFCERVMTKAELPFYREMAKLTKDFVLSETEALGRTDSIVSQ